MEPNPYDPARGIRIRNIVVGLLLAWLVVIVLVALFFGGGVSHFEVKTFP